MTHVLAIIHLEAYHKTSKFVHKKYGTYNILWCNPEWRVLQLNIDYQEIKLPKLSPMWRWHFWEIESTLKSADCERHVVWSPGVEGRGARGGRGADGAGREGLTEAHGFTMKEIHEFDKA